MITHETLTFIAYNAKYVYPAKGKGVNQDRLEPHLPLEDVAVFLDEVDMILEPPFHFDGYELLTEAA